MEPAAVFVVDSASGGQFTTLAALMHSFNDSLNDDIANCRFDAATATFVNSQTGDAVTLADAVSAGLIGPALDVDQMSTNLAVLRALGPDVDASLAGIRDPRTGDELSLAEAIQAGLVDLSAGELVNPDTGERLAPKRPKTKTAHENVDLLAPLCLSLLLSSIISMMMRLLLDVSICFCPTPEPLLVV